ncbi:MAG: hypothetical protein QXO12_00940 [Candidatus Pacearchaeota archaeon]
MAKKIKIAFSPEIKKEENKESLFFLTSFILAIIIFLFGLLLGNYIASSKISQFKETEEKFLIYLIGYDISQSILNEDICNIDLDKFFEEKAKLGRMLTNLEERLGKENKEIINKKDIYQLIEIKMLEYFEKAFNNCNKSFNIVLFFYTNKKNDYKGSVDASEDQGKILDQVVYEHNEKKKGNPVYVFSFDINSNNPAIITLILKYNVTNAPTLIINGKKYNYLVKSEIEDILL